MPDLRQLLKHAIMDARRVFERFRRLDREALAAHFLRGEGIEIGALHNPLKVPRGVKVRYVDRMPVAELRRHYPELAHRNLVDVDVVDDGEKLYTLPDASQDFVVANHFLEHCENPIETLGNLLRTVRIGGVLFTAIPDKRYTFDVDRAVTPFDHLLRDYREGPAWSREEHFVDWARYVERVSEGEDLARRVAALKAQAYSIHYHVWTAAEILELYQRLNDCLKQSVEIECLFQGNGEVVMVTRRSR